MARRKGGTKRGGRKTRKSVASRRKSVSRPKGTKKPARRAKPRRATTRTGASRRAAGRAAKASRKAKLAAKPVPARLNRERRRLEDSVPTPPSSLNMRRQGSSVRTGRRGLAESLEEHTGMTPALTGGDVDANWEEAYFSGDEAPGGDNPTPDQDIVDEIGKSLGVEYQDNEELKSSDKVSERDKHRWELDPASSEDYKERE